MISSTEGDLTNGFFLGATEVRPKSGQIVRDGQVYHVKQKTMDLLVALACSSEHCASKDALLLNAWSQSKPAYSALSHAISELRKALGDHSTHPTYIETVRGKGYRLLVPPTLGASNQSKPVLADSGGDPVNEGVQSTRLNSLIFAARQNRLIKISAAFVLSIWVLIQVLEVILPILALPGWILKLAVLIFTVGFPIFILSCWYLELRKKRKHLQTLEDSKQKRHLRHQIAFEFVYIVAISVAVLFLAAHLKQVVEVEANSELLFVTNGSEGIPSNTFAVLPVQYAENAGLPGHLVNGLQGELIQGLSNVDGIKVSSERASRSITSEHDVSSIRERLKVSYLIEGFIKVLGDQPQLTLTLIETESGHQIWQDTVEFSQAHFIETLSAATRKLVNAIKLSIKSITWRDSSYVATSNFDAYDNYMQAKELMRFAEDERAYQRASTLLLKALQLDSGFSQASSALCQSYLYHYQLSLEPDSYDLALQACKHASQLRETGPQSHAALAQLHFLSGNYDLSQTEFLRALELDPDSAEIRINYSELLLEMQLTKDAELQAREAIALEPGFWRNYESYGRLLMTVGRFQQAAKQFESVTALRPNSASAHNSVGAAYYLSGEFQKATAAWKKSLDIEPNELTYSNLGTALYHDGKYAEAAHMYGKAVELSPRSFTIIANKADALKYVEKRESEVVSLYRRALTMAREIEAINKEDQELRSQIARYLAELEECAESQHYMTGLLEEGSNSTYVYYDLALSESLCGDANKVLELLKESIKLGYPAQLLLADRQFLGYRERLQTDPQ